MVFLRSQSGLHPLFNGLATRDEVCCIRRTSSMKILGIHVQSNLKFDTHVADYTTRASRNLYLLTRLKQYGFIPKELKMLFSDLVLSVLTYGLTVWSGSTNYLLEKLTQFRGRQNVLELFPLGVQQKTISVKQIEFFCRKFVVSICYKKFYHRGQITFEKDKPRLPSSSETNKLLPKSIFPKTIPCKYQ